MRQRGQTHWRDVVSKLPMAQQREWAATAEARAMMGDVWCRQLLGRLNEVELRLRKLAPSGWWYDEAWSGRAQMPPQEPYCPLAVVAHLYGLAAAGRLRPKRLKFLLALVGYGVDAHQVLTRWSARMRLSVGHSAMPDTAYDADRQPVRVPPTRRLTPPQSVGHAGGCEDRYDTLSAAGALFCRDEPSVTAVQFQRIGLLKGREQGEEDRRRRESRKRKRERVAAAKARAGVVDDAPPPVENILDETIDVDCTDVRPADSCAMAHGGAIG